MNAKFVLIVPISALLLSASGLSMAAAGEGATAYQKAQPDMHGKGASGMGGMGGMMGQGAKGGDMMGACPMMGDAFAHWKLLRIDVTKNTTADAAMLRRFGLFGPPALIFYDRNGRQQADAQLVGFVGADAFLEHLKQWDR